MGVMFGEQAVRLLRKNWPDANQLAQELYAMFQNDIPLTMTAPLTLRPPRGQPALIIVPPPLPGPLILVRNPDGTPLGGLSFGDVNLGDGPFNPTPLGDLNLPSPTRPTDPGNQDLYWNGRMSDPRPVHHRPPRDPNAPVAAGGGAFPGQVASGSDAAYQVAVYENGLAVGSTGTVTVRVAGLAAGQSLSAGTWLTVCKSALDTFDAVANVWAA